MRRSFAIAVLALSFCSFYSLTQEALTTGSIEGIVVRADTDQPIASAQVTLTPVGAAEIATVSTGADGKFNFRNLLPATYRVAVTANGFVRQEYGQRGLGGSGWLLFVQSGQSITDANIRITPAGTISGRILDQDGKPATAVPVQLLKRLFNTQGRAFQPAGTASTDDRGNYRIFNVTPGRYYLVAGTQPAVTNLTPQRILSLPTGSARYSVKYHPNVSSVDEATTIEVKSGADSTVDMRLERVTQTFNVRGRVINTTGAPFPSNLTAMLGYSTFSGAGNANRPDSFDPVTGMFNVSNVPPGEFTIQIAQPAQPPRGTGGTLIAEQQARALAASVSVRVTNSDIDGLVLTPTAAVTAQGKLIVEGAPISAVPNLAQLRVNVRGAVLTITGMTVSTPIAADGSFQVSGFREGEYRAQMNMVVPGFYVKSIKLGKEDILGTTFKFTSDSPTSIEVVLKAGTQTISGTVTDSLSKPVPGIVVVLVPAQRGIFELYRATNTDQAGKFSMVNIDPGEYKIFSWEAIDSGGYMDPDFLKQYEELGKLVNVTEFSSSSVEVKLIPAQ